MYANIGNWIAMFVCVSFAILAAVAYGQFEQPLTESPEIPWTGRWMPHPPSSEYANIHDPEHGVQMGFVTAECDDAKTNLTIDWDYSLADYTCYSYNRKYLPVTRTKPILECENIPKYYSARHECMNKSIHYASAIPTYGTHRPLWPRYGEYKFVPRQRWLHNLEYNMFVKGVAEADQYLSYYSLLRKTVKWPKKVAFWLINCGFFNSFRIYQKLNPTSKTRYKEFLLQVAKDWAAGKVETDTDAACPGTSTQTPRVPHEEMCPGRLSGDMRKHVLEKIVGSERGKRKYPAWRGHVCETRYICKFCLVPLHKGECFQRYHTLKHY